MLSAVNAKEQCVKEFGIGEDLPMSIFCWKDHALELVLSLALTPEVRDHTERFKRVSDAICIVKKAWHIDAITMVAEGWVSTNPEATAGQDLHIAYLSPESPVSTCLTITHVENDEVTFIAKPYKQTWGRKVDWEDELYFPGSTKVRGQDAMYPNLFSRVLREVEHEAPPEDEATYYAALGDGLMKRGFACQWM